MTEEWRGIMKLKNIVGCMMLFIPIIGFLIYIGMTISWWGSVIVILASIYILFAMALLDG